MALPSTGIISMEMVNTELKKGARDRISLNDADVRKLANKPSGTISMADLRGKSNEEIYTLNVKTNGAEYFPEYGYNEDPKFGDIYPKIFDNQNILMLSTFFTFMNFKLDKHKNPSKDIKISILDTQIYDLLSFDTNSGIYKTNGEHIDNEKGESYVARYIIDQYYYEKNYNIQLTIEYVD